MMRRGIPSGYPTIHHPWRHLTFFFFFFSAWIFLSNRKIFSNRIEIFWSVRSLEFVIQCSVRPEMFYLLICGIVLPDSFPIYIYICLLKFYLIFFSYFLILASFEIKQRTCKILKISYFWIWFGVQPGHITQFRRDWSWNNYYGRSLPSKAVVSYLIYFSLNWPLT